MYLSLITHVPPCFVFSLSSFLINLFLFIYLFTFSLLLLIFVFLFFLNKNKYLKIIKNYYVGARPVLVRFTPKKSNHFLKLFFKYLLKNYVTLISHFEWEYVGPRSILVGPKKFKKYLCFFFSIFVLLFLGKINILKITSALHF